MHANQVQHAKCQSRANALLTITRGITEFPAFDNLRKHHVGRPDMYISDHDPMRNWMEWGTSDVEAWIPPSMHDRVLRRRRGPGELLLVGGVTCRFRELAATVGHLSLRKVYRMRFSRSEKEGLK